VATWFFESDVSATTQLEHLFERAVAERLGLETDFFIRTANNWKAIIAGNPFPKEPESDPSHLLVTFLKQTPAREGVKALQTSIRVAS